MRDEGQRRIRGFAQERQRTYNRPAVMDRLSPWRTVLVVAASASIAGAVVSAAPTTVLAQYLPTATCNPTSVPAAGPGRQQQSYRVMFGVVAVPSVVSGRASPSGRSGPWRFFDKQGLFTRAGSPAVVFSVPKAWRTRVAIGWGDGAGPASALRVTSCSGPSGEWNGYPGGYFLRAPTPVCAPLVVRLGGRSATVHVGIGRSCGVGEVAAQQQQGAQAWPVARFTPVAMPASGQCPRSPGGRAAPAVGITLGDGPAYPVLGFPLGSAPPSPDGVVSLRADRPRVNGRYAQKLLWAVAPNAARFTVTAGRLRGASGDRRLAFDLGDGTPQPDLHLMGSSTWTYQPTAILVKRPGCYELQINGPAGSSTLVFQSVP